MTNFKFRLSGIVPNAWFCKLKEMSKSRKCRSSGHQHKSNRLEPFKIIQPMQDSVPQKEALLPNRASYYLSSRAKVEAETVLQRKKSSTKSSNSPSHESLKLQLQLPPIMTKKVRADAKAKGTRRQSQIQRFRMHASSPRVAANKKLQLARNSVSSQMGESRSFAVVKSSTNPRKDFRDSMVEMIREYGITTSKELEDLLACYLLLNANVHHDVIVKVFQQVCFHHTDDS